MFDLGHVPSSRLLHANRRLHPLSLRLLLVHTFIVNASVFAYIWAGLEEIKVVLVEVKN